MADPFIGKTLSSSTFKVTESLIEDYRKGLNLSASQNGAIPAMITSGLDNAYFRETAFDYQVGHLWMRQQWEFYRAVDQTTSYDVSGEVTDIYMKRNRQVVKYRVDFHKPDGEMAIRSYHHQSFLREPIEGENVEFRDPTKKPGARKFVVPEGHRFGGQQKSISKEMCGVFFHGDANYHTDEEAAKELGFNRVVVGGRMTMAYAGELLSDYFGEAWDTSGKLDLKFTNPVWCDDLLTINGVELKEQPDNALRQAFVWLQKEDGSIAYVAEASVNA